jgi:enoyl-CoA hydratase/carnithine racemase
MPVRIERNDSMLTVILSRPEARNAVDPEHAQALHQAFIAFDTDDAADVAVFWGEGGGSAPAQISKAWPRAPSPRRKTGIRTPHWSFPPKAARFRAARWGRLGCGLGNR